MPTKPSACIQDHFADLTDPGHADAAKNSSTSSPETGRLSISETGPIALSIAACAIGSPRMPEVGVRPEGAPLDPTQAWSGLRGGLRLC